MDGYHMEETDNRTKRGYSPATSDSDTDGDDLGDEEDIDFRKNIKPILNLGQTITALWPISLIEHAEDVENDYEENLVLSRSSSSGYFTKEGFIGTKHRRAPSLPSQLKLDEIKLKLDEIQLNNDDEYGFNPNRSRSTRLRSTRPVSLYSSNERISDMIGLGISKQLDEFFLSVKNLDYTKSHARNAKEAKLEREIVQLRSQPSKVEFSRKNEAKENLKQLLNHRNARKMKPRSKSLRRKLSFDSHPRRRAFSDTENAAKKSKKSYEQIDDANDADNVFDTNASSHSKSKENQLDFNRCESDPSLSKQREEVILAAPPVLQEKQIFEVLVSKAPSEEKGKRKRPSIPQFLNALKLPNKKAIKKFIRRKNDQQQKSTAPAIPLPSENITDDFIQDETERNRESQPASSSINTFDKSVSRSTEKRSRNRRLYSTSSSGSKISCSLCSLPRVQEGKESSQTDGTLSRKSCSTCSIVVAKFLGGTKDSQIPVLERRMSDTALTWREERQPGCSPGRRFIYRLLSPVVCGFNNEKYSNIQACDSYTSLTSCSSDVSAEAEFLSQKLSDFDPVEIAEELALIDKELLIRITWQELSNCGWMSRNKYVTSPNVMNMVEFFNRVAMMVASSILAEDAVHIRAKIITRMIKLAYRCRVLKNYNSLRAVLGGLQCTPIFRLKATWKQVRSKRKRLFSELSNLMGEADNFAGYRAELNRSLQDPPCLPFLGDFLTQIAQTQAYIAVQRKRSLAKQRLERASMCSSASKGPSVKASDVTDEKPVEIVSETENSGIDEEYERTGIDTDSAETGIDNNKNNDNTLTTELYSENSKNNLEESGLCSPSQNEAAMIPSSSSDPDGTDSSCLLEYLSPEDEEKEKFFDERNRCLSPDLFPVKVQNLESAKDLIDLHDIVLGCSPYEKDDGEREERMHVNDDDDDNSQVMNCCEDNSARTNEDNDEEMVIGNERTDVIRRTEEISSITGNSRNFLGSDYEILELSNIEQDCSEVNDVPVFVDDEESEKILTADKILHSSFRTFSFDASATDAENSHVNEHTNTGTKQGSINAGYNIEQSSCPEDDEVRDSTVESSHFLSPDDKTPEIKLDDKEQADKRTHARCDSNDSGVVLHNGRSSRASDDINGSRENLDLTVTGTDNSGFEDSKHHHEIDVIIEDATDFSDSRENNENLPCTRNENLKTSSSPLLKEDHAEETRKLEEKIKRWKPAEEEAKLQKEFQFWQYQIACMQYNYPSRPAIRRFLLNACYNSEEENYRLSLKQEPISK